MVTVSIFRDLAAMARRGARRAASIPPPRWPPRRTQPEPPTPEANLSLAQVGALQQRLRALLEVIEPISGDGSASANEQVAIVPWADAGSTLSHLSTALAARLPLDKAHVWLLLAVLTGHLPARDTVVQLQRRSQLDGLEPVLADLLNHAFAPDEASPQSVRIVRDSVLLDVHNTALAMYATGVQRVTREVSQRWVRDHDLLLVGWTPELTALRALSDAEVHRIIDGGPLVPASPTREVVVPWRCTYVVPELATEPLRTARLQSLAELSGSSLGLIGYDLIPVTTAETCYELSGGFVTGLAAARQARTIAPISEAAAGEFRGWTRMLSGTGLPGPAIEAVVLPTEVPPADPQQVERARARLTVGSLPLVLVVGSHEPRKNHLAVLHAAEMLWCEGLRFSLTLIGGNSWNSAAFNARLEELKQAGRPVEAITAGTDDLLWGAYRSARFTVFPSLNEGFGLPLAESLSCGTPAVTSGFGSLREIAEMGGGALFVDPRDDRSVADGMRALLTDNALLDQLRAEAGARPVRTWDAYAAQLWQVMTRDSAAQEPSMPAL